MNTKYFMAALISIAVGLVLLPVVITFKTNAQTSINDSASAEHTIVGLIPMFWALGCLGVGAGMVYAAFKG